jgi:hypothetical protein
MCGDIAVVLIPMPPGRRFGKSRRVAFNGASGRYDDAPSFRQQSRDGLSQRVVS